MTSTARTSTHSRSKSESLVLNAFGGRASVKVELNQDWTEFLSALIAHRVRFVLVGGHAVAGHAEPRFTEDLDVFVEPTLANARRLRAALVAFGFGEATPPPGILATPDKVFMLGRKPTRIDILTGIDGVSFDDVWKGRVEAEFKAAPLYVIGREQLLANKRAAGRTKDLLDVAALERLSPILSAVKTKPKARTKAATDRRRRAVATVAKRRR